MKKINSRYEFINFMLPTYVYNCAKAVLSSIDGGVDSCYIWMHSIVSDKLILNCFKYDVPEVNGSKGFIPYGSM